MNIKPLPGWVLIEPEKEDNTTESGIMLPDSSQDFPMKGKAVAIWDFKELVADITITSFEDYKAAVIKQNLNKDDIVLFKKYAGQTIKQNGKELKLVEFKDLLAVVEDGEV